MNSVRPILGGALLAVLLLATAGHAGSRPGVMFAWHALVLAAALVAWCFASPGGTGRRPAAGVALGLTALGVVAAGGIVRAPYFFSAWLTLIELAAFLAVLVLAVRSSDWLIRRLAPVLVLGGWIQTALLVYQRFFQHDPRPAGSFLNPNYLAGWLAATMLFCAGRLLNSPDCRIARWSAMAAAPLLAGFVLTGSRGGLVSLGGGGVLLTALAWPRLKPRGRRAVVAVLVIVGLAGSTALALRMRQPDPFRYQRLKIWQASITPLLSDPWTGTGPGQFARASHNLQFPDGRGALRYDRGFRTTHSDWIRAGAELGWPGLLALAWIVVSVAAHVARRRRGADPVDAGAVAALCGLFLQAAVDNVTRAPALYLLAATCLGLVIAVEAPARRAVRPVWRLLAAAMVVYLFAIGDVVPWHVWSQRVNSHHPPGPAPGWNPADAEGWMRSGESVGVTSGDFQGRPLAEYAIGLSPGDGELLRRLARLEVRGLSVDPLHRASRDRIVSLFRRSESLQRTNPFVPMELSAFLLDSGDPAGARRAAERALEIEPKAATPRLLMARALLDAGDPDRAMQWLESARTAERENVQESLTSDYARDLLRLDHELVIQIVDSIAAARQSDQADPRFGEDQEEEAGG